MKKLLTTIILLTIIATLHAQAPELKNMMPNSWQKLTRLSEEEEKEFLAKEEVISDIDQFKSDSWASPEYIIQEKRVYKEIVNNIEFFRVFVCNQNMNDFFDSTYCDKVLSKESFSNFKYHRVQQIVYAKDKFKDIYKIKELEYKVYGATTDDWGYFIFNDIMIKPLNEKEIGFFITEVGVSFSVDRTRWDEDIVSIKFYTCKDQILGSNSTEFLSVNIQEDLSKAFNDSDRRIRIQASSFLFDSKSPLKYSIQNAFDGNPATSYVENTEDDLMKVIFQYRGQYYVKRIGIINGYAANKNLYNSNSRIFKMKCGVLATTTNLYPDPINIEFKDNEMSYQYFDFLSDTHFYVTDIFKGQKYSDTCLAEINLYTNKEYWLFGDINE
ncbi:MAG: hypothetical protein J6J11_02265 [Treponema sp.]|nr:hypothetical protein [Treponema sp.]